MEVRSRHVNFQKNHRYEVSALFQSLVIDANEVETTNVTFLLLLRSG